MTLPAILTRRPRRGRHLLRVHVDPRDPGEYPPPLRLLALGPTGHAAAEPVNDQATQTRARSGNPGYLLPERTPACLFTRTRRCQSATRSAGDTARVSPTRERPDRGINLC